MFGKLKADVSKRIDSMTFQSALRYPGIVEGMYIASTTSRAPDIEQPQPFDLSRAL